MKKAKISKEKLRDVLLVSCLALLLVFAVWKIFYTPGATSRFSSGTSGGSAATTASAAASEKEKSLSAFLSEMDGVGSAEVRICEDEDGVLSVAVVCDGAKNIRVNSDIREAVSAALGVDEKNVKIYPKSK